MLNINGVEFEFDLMDADVADLTENALQIFSEAHQKIERTGSLADSIRDECKLVFDFFDTVFGEGAAQAVFKGKHNYTTCCKAFEEVIRAIGDYNKMLADRQMNMAQSFNGSLNAAKDKEKPLTRPVTKKRYKQPLA